MIESHKARRQQVKNEEPIETPKQRQGNDKAEEASRPGETTDKTTRRRSQQDE